MVSETDISTGNENYDVVIVGGGPAGVSCAITVAKEGFRVAIIDKKDRLNIGDKTCGDAVDKAALQRFKDGTGIDFPTGDEVSDPIIHMSIAAVSVNTKLTLVAPGYVVDRLIYGQRLLREAEDLDVKVIPKATVREIIIEKIDREEYLQGVKYMHGGETHEIRAKFTIDASGAYAVIRKKLPKSFLQDGITADLKKDELWPTYREILELKEGVKDHDFANEILLLYKDDFAAPGYFWIFSKGDRKLNCGIGWTKEQSETLGSVKKAYNKEMENYYSKEDYNVIKTGGGQIPIRPPFDSLVFNGGALVGDSACMVHPVTAEGHAPALDTAMNLGNAIIDALKSGERNKKSLWSYNIAVSHHYALKHNQAILMRNFMESAGASSLEYLIKKRIFRNEELDLLFSGDELVLSLWDKLSRARKLIFKPKILLGMKRIFDGLDKCEKIFNEYPTDPEKLQAWREKRNKLLNVNY